MKNNTLPNQFYLQQKIKSILEENGKNSTNAIYYLRELVKQNLILFREEFNDSYPNTVKSEDKKERKNQTVILSTKYFHDAYFKYITQDEISITLQENCLFLLDKKGNTRTIRDFIYENDYTEGKDYRVTIVLDFLSIALGFEGWKEAEKFDFDITKKPKKINKNKIAIKSNQETLHKIEDVKEIVLENQNNNKEEIKSEIKSNNLILEKVENNILNEVKNLKFDIHKSKLPKYLTIEMPIIYENEIIGLKNDLQDIYERLHKKNTLIINSIGGIGKTTLAAVYGTKNLNYYKHILWINKNSNHDFKNSLIKSEGLINNLQIKKEDKDLDDIFTEILIKLNSIDNHPCLMIIDNAEEDLNDYKNKLPNPPNWHILITSREKLSSFEDTEIKELNSLSPKLAVKLFKKHYERKNLDDKIIYNIVKDLDYHTLTIEIIAKTTKDLDKTPEFILNFLRSNPVANVKVRHSDKKIDRIHSYLCAVFQKLTKLDEENKRLLLILSFLPSNFLSYKKLKKLISIET